MIVKHYLNKKIPTSIAIGIIIFLSILVGALVRQ